MTLSQQKLDGLIAQLAMAEAAYPVRPMAVALLRAQIKALREEMEHVPVEPVECYSVSRRD